VVTTQSHLLTSLCGILQLLQSPQRDAIEDGHKNSAKRARSGAQRFKVKGQLRKRWPPVFGLTPQSMHSVVICIHLLARLSVVWPTGRSLGQKFKGPQFESACRWIFAPRAVARDLPVTWWETSLGRSHVTRKISPVGNPLCSRAFPISMRGLKPVSNEGPLGYLGGFPKKKDCQSLRDDHGLISTCAF